MTITLGGIELPDLVYDQEFDNKIQSIMNLSLNGTQNIWEQSVPNRSIDLIGTSDSGWIKKSELSDLFSLASVPFASYILSYEGNEIPVRFRNEDVPVIEASPVIARPDSEDTDYYNNVRIKLMEI